MSEGENHMEPITLPPDAVLLVIDVQQAIDTNRAPRNNPNAEAQIGRLLAAWRQAGRPLIHIRDNGSSPASPFAPGAPGHAFKEAVQPLPGETVLDKWGHSAFVGTDLEARLRAAGQDTLVIAGLTVNQCVETTTRMAGNLGFTVYLVGDATAAWDRTGPDGRTHHAADIHSVSLANLHGEFATVTDTEAVLGAVERR